MAPIRDTCNTALSGVSLIRYTVYMGKNSTTQVVTAFAQKTCAYLAHLHRESGMTYRALEQATGRSRSTIGRYLNGEQAMNANDVEVFAVVYGLTPYEFVSNARTFEIESSTSSNVTRGPWPTSHGATTITEEEALELGAVAKTDGELIEIDEFPEG